jgi:signal transduction protein with GAF and PtsI domain
MVEGSTSEFVFIMATSIDIPFLMRGEIVFSTTRALSKVVLDGILADLALVSLETLSASSAW